jgi:alkylhydroperoxidase family enzyme
LAKRCGVTDEQIEGMEQLEKHRSLFKDEDYRALKYAEQVTVEAHGVTDTDMEALRSVFGEKGIIELTCVIGLFCYFNRFNNALRIDITK